MYKMSLLSAKRLSVKLGHQLRAMSLIRQCGELFLDLPVARRLCGIRHYCQSAYTDTEDAKEIARKTHVSSRTTDTQKSHKFSKKLYSRLQYERVLVDRGEFLSQRASEKEEDTIDTHAKRRDANKISRHSPRLKTRQQDKFSTLDAQAGSQHDTDLTDDFAEMDAVDEKRNKAFTHRPMYKQQKQSWSDVFGTLSENSLADRIEESRSTTVGSHEERFSDDEDEKESMRIRLSDVNRRHIPEWYGRKILKLGKHGKVREALEVFESWMLKEDRVKPNAYVFTCLITVLGRAGYTKKAFSLFRKMQSMGIQPKPATYTALFNACANSPWKSDGHARADKLLRLMEEKEVEPTLITGKAMVKAFAMCGDLRRAFSLVDKLSKVYQLDPEMFSFLLMACISDKEAGLRHAVQVWRVMEQMGVHPDRPLYNLLLRCVRDCGVGDLPSFTAVITGGTATTVSRLDKGSDQVASFPSKSRTDSRILSIEALEQATEVHSASANHNSKQLSSESDTEKLGQQNQPPPENDRFKSPQTEVSSQNELQSNLQLGNEQSDQHSLSAPLTLHSSVTIPDVLSPKQHHHESMIMSLGDLSTKESRLLLLGGVDGVLSRMARDRACPDIITFTQLLSVVMPTVKAELELLDRMREQNVRPDIDLINTLIHRRCLRADFVAAKATGELMSEFGLTANQMTYGVLAMTCRTQEEAAQLLESMEAADMAANMEILGTLMYASGMKFGYKMWVLRQAQRLGLSPNEKFLHNVEKGLSIVRQKILHAEKKGHTASHLLSPEFQHSVETFTQHYESWLKQTQVQIPGHPWANFRPRDMTSNHTKTDTV